MSCPRAYGTGCEADLLGDVDPPSEYREPGLEGLADRSQCPALTSGPDPLPKWLRPPGGVDVPVDVSESDLDTRRTAYRHAMNYEWMAQRLLLYIDALDDFQEERVSPGSAAYVAVQRYAGTAQRILAALDPELGKTDFNDFGEARANVARGMGLARDLRDLRVNLLPDGPVLGAETLHPWAWEAACPFWETGHFSSGLEQAWKAINAHIQGKSGRREISDDKLVNEVFSDDLPTPGRPRLHVPGDRSSQTWASRQRGLRSFAGGCAWGIRNVVVHEHELALSEQQALEYLASLSVLSRWVDETNVVCAE